MLLGEHGGSRADYEKDRHHCEEGPSLAAITDHLAEGVSQSRADRKNREQLEEVGQRSWIFVRMRRVGIEKSAAISTEFLNNFLRRYRTLRDRLRSAVERRRVDVRI